MLMNRISPKSNPHAKVRHSRGRKQSVLALVALIAGAWSASAWAQEPASRTIPARLLPVPDTVSPVLQKRFQQAPNPSPAIPKTAEEWKALASTPPLVSQMREPGMGERAGKSSEAESQPLSAAQSIGIPYRVGRP
jgi:hypothetical protein